EHLSPIGEIGLVEEKQYLMDLFVKDAKGKRYGIEMQVASHGAFLERMVYYGCRRYGEQLKSGESYLQLRPLILIIITNFNVQADFAGYKDVYQLIGKESGLVFSDHFSIVLVELPKFKKLSSEVS